MEVIHKARPGTKVKGRISLAESAGMQALTATVNRIQHERRQLTMKDQELAEELEGAVEEYEKAWREIAEAHGFDPQVPCGHWALNKKGRVTLDPKCHPDKPPPKKVPEPGEGPEEKKDDTTDHESAADGEAGGDGPEGGAPGTPHLVGGDPDKDAGDDRAPTA